MTHKAEAGVRILEANLSSPKRLLRAEITVSEPVACFTPLQFITKMENGKIVFTQKAAGLRAQGIVTMNTKTIDLMPEEAWAILDWTDGFFNRNTYWNWACGGGKSVEGNQVGFNALNIGRGGCGGALCQVVSPLNCTANG